MNANTQSKKRKVEEALPLPNPPCDVTKQLVRALYYQVCKDEIELRDAYVQELKTRLLEIQLHLTF